MQKYIVRLSKLRRPRLLMWAARIGAQEFQRQSQLPRILRNKNLTDEEQVVSELIDIECEIEERRVSGNLDYSISQHVDILTALLAELDLYKMKKRHLFGDANSV